MGLLRSCLEVLEPHLRGASILSLGYPDLAVTNADLQALFGVRAPANQITGRPDTAAALRALGATMRAIDVRRSRGVEEIVDLNVPQELGQYDLVLDAGTIEHCFNVGTALMNAAGAVRVGGRIFHTPPLSMVNHGFFNLCPTLLYDFYGQNGWEIELLVGREAMGRGASFSLDPIGRAPVPAECVIHCLARRTTEGPLLIPVQAKYRQ
jgi:hypothetical protein